MLDESWWQRRLGPFSVATWVGVAILVVAAALRFSLVESARLTGDEARDWRIGVDIARFKAFPALGAQITDGRAQLPGPIFYYLVAIPSLISKQPEAQFLFIEALGALSVWVFWRALRGPFGEFGAALAGFVAACSPWAALYADRTWNPNLLPAAGFLAILAAVRLREDPKSAWLAVLLPTVFGMAQLHMSAPVFWLGIAPLVAGGARQWSRRWLLVGVGATVALYLPFIGHELWRDFANTKAILAETVGAKKEHHEWAWAWVPVYLARLMTLDITYHENMGYWGGPDEWKNLASLWKGTAARPFHALRFFALLCSASLMLASFAAAARAWWTTRRVSAWAVAFVVVLVANTAFMAASGKQVFGHYVILMLPIALVAYAHLGAHVAASPRLRAVVIALAVVFCLGGLEATTSYSWRVDGRNGIGVHRGVLNAIAADRAKEGLPDGEPVRLDLGVPGGSLWHYDVFQQIAMDRPARFSGGATKLKYRLTDASQTLPAGAVQGGPVDLGAARLWRMK